MFIKQLSVFIENREGRIELVTDTLKNADVNILALSMADTTDFGMIRMIVSDPQKAAEALKNSGFTARLTDVIAVCMEDKPGQLHLITHILVSNSINIEYMYSLATSNKLAIILKTSDEEKAGAKLTEGGLKLYSDRELC